MRFSLALILAVAPFVIAVSQSPTLLSLYLRVSTDIQRPGKIEARQGGCVEACLNQLSGFDVSLQCPVVQDRS